MWNPPTSELLMWFDNATFDRAAFDVIFNAWANVQKLINKKYIKPRPFFFGRLYTFMHLTPHTISRQLSRLIWHLQICGHPFFPSASFQNTQTNLKAVSVLVLSLLEPWMDEMASTQLSLPPSLSLFLSPCLSLSLPLSLFLSLPLALSLSLSLSRTLAVCSVLAFIAALPTHSSVSEREKDLKGHFQNCFSLFFRVS